MRTDPAGATPARPKRPPTERQRAASRQNARASTGPRTATGKAKVAQNARRHGLSIPIACDLGYAAEIERVTREITRSLPNAGPKGAPPPMKPAHYAVAVRRIAEAQADVERVRRVRASVVARAHAALEREGANAVHILTEHVDKLWAIDRYQGRAFSRRNRAIRALDAARAGRPNKANARGAGVTPASGHSGTAGVPPALSRPQRDAGVPPALPQNKANGQKDAGEPPAVPGRGRRNKATAPIPQNKANGGKEAGETPALRQNKPNASLQQNKAKRKRERATSAPPKPRPPP